MAGDKQEDGVKRYTTAITAVVVTLTLVVSLAAAVRKTAVYLSLPERLDRLEKNVEDINTKMDTVLLALPGRRR